MAELDAKIIEELKAKHPGQKLVQLEGAGATVVVRPPTKAEFDKFRAHMDDERRRPKALEYLFRGTVVYPEVAAVEALIDRLPGLSVRFGAEVLELAGAVQAVEKKEL